MKNFQRLTSTIETYLCIVSCIDFRKLYWIDEGGNGVPLKIGKANMDGSNASILVQGQLYEALALDLENGMLYYSTEGAVSN